MSLVIAAMSYRCRIALQSKSINAVFPDPTGPPMPMRSGPWDLDMSNIPLVIVAPAFVFAPGRLGGWNRCRRWHPLHRGAPSVMELILHANTTPRVRSYIQRSRKAVAELVAELGVSETTIRRWRGRTTVGDRSHRPKRLMTSLSAMEETLVCELRTSLQLPLDDIVEVMRRCVND